MTDVEHDDNPEACAGEPIPDPWDLPDGTRVEIQLDGAWRDITEQITEVRNG